MTMPLSTWTMRREASDYLHLLHLQEQKSLPAVPPSHKIILFCLCFHKTSSVKKNSIFCHIVSRLVELTHFAIRAHSLHALLSLPHISSHSVCDSDTIHHPQGPLIQPPRAPLYFHRLFLLTTTMLYILEPDSQNRVELLLFRQVNNASELRARLLKGDFAAAFVNASLVCPSPERQRRHSLNSSV